MTQSNAFVSDDMCCDRRLYATEHCGFVDCASEPVFLGATPASGMLENVPPFGLKLVESELNLKHNVTIAICRGFEHETAFWRARKHGSWSGGAAARPRDTRAAFRVGTKIEPEVPAKAGGGFTSC